MVANTSVSTVNAGCIRRADMGEIPIPDDLRPALVMQYCHIEAGIWSVRRCLTNQNTDTSDSANATFHAQF